MRTDAVHPQRAGSGGPWFQQRPGLAAVVASALFAAVLGLRYAVRTPEPITLLFCLPIALLAVAFGRRVGLLAGAAGILLLVTWVAADGVVLSFWDWISRVLPMLLLGGLLGDAADKLRRSEDERLRLQAAAQRHRDAVGLQDDVVQQLAAAKWALEAGDTERGLTVVTDTLVTAQHLVSDMLRESDRAAGGRPGQRAPAG